MVDETLETPVDDARTLAEAELDSLGETASPSAAPRADEVEDLFDLAPLTVHQDPEEDDASPTFAEEPAAPVRRRTSAVPTGPASAEPPRGRALWLAIGGLTALHLLIAVAVLVNLDRKTSKILETMDRGPASEPALAESTGTHEPRPVPNRENAPVPSVEGSEGQASTRAEVEPIHPALRDAARLFDLGRYAEARRKYFEVLLSPAPGQGGRDASAAKLGIARCLSREGLAVQTAGTAQVKRSAR